MAWKKNNYNLVVFVSLFVCFSILHLMSCFAYALLLALVMVLSLVSVLMALKGIVLIVSDMGT